MLVTPLHTRVISFCYIAVITLLCIHDLSLQTTDIALADGSTVSKLLVIDKVYRLSIYYCISKLGTEDTHQVHASLCPQDRVLMETIGAVQQLKRISVRKC